MSSGWTRSTRRVVRAQDPHPALRRVVAAREEDIWRHVEGVSELPHGVEREVTSSVLQVPDVSAFQTRRASEVLLRQPSARPELTQCSAEGEAALELQFRVGHAGQRRRLRPVRRRAKGPRLIVLRVRVHIVVWCLDDAERRAPWNRWDLSRCRRVHWSRVE